jgi:hypothetical protein
MSVSSVGNDGGRPSAWCFWFEGKKRHSGVFALVLLCYKSQLSSAAKRTARKLLKKNPADFDVNRGDGVWMMTLSAYAASHGA